MNVRDESIADEIKFQAHCRASKRSARRILGPTATDIAEYDAWMDRWIAQSEDRVRRLEGSRP